MKISPEKVIHNFMLFTFLLCLSGCNTMPTRQQPVVSIPFDDAPFQPYLKEGTAKIVGQAFLKTRGGDVKFGAGNTVELIPNVGYFADRFYLVSHGGNAGPRDQRLTPYIRSAIADADGNFEFSNLPAGRYVVLCQIEWEYPNMLGGVAYMAKTGGQAVAEATISDGESKRVVVTR